MQQQLRKQAAASHAGSAGRVGRRMVCRGALSTGGLHAPPPPPAWPGRVAVPELKPSSGPKVCTQGPSQMQHLHCVAAMPLYELSTAMYHVPV
eukprot:1157367-Pelagomonas_calceolata.AAC.1